MINLEAEQSDLRDLDLQIIKLPGSLAHNKEIVFKWLRRSHGRKALVTLSSLKKKSTHTFFILFVYLLSWRKTCLHLKEEKNDFFFFKTPRIKDSYLSNLHASLHPMQRTRNDNKRKRGKGKEKEKERKRRHASAVFERLGEIHDQGPSVV